MRPSRATRKIVLSPAIVPITSGSTASSIAWQSAGAKPEWVRMHGEVAARVDRHRPAAQRGGQLREPVEVDRAGQRVDEPAVAVAGLHEPELGDVARDGGLDRVVALLAQRLGHLGLGCERTLLDETQDRALTVELAHWSTSWRSPSACPSSSVVIVKGGVRRSTVSPAEPTTSPRSRAASTTGPAGRSSSSAEHQAATAHLDDAREGREPCGETRALLPDVREQLVGERVADRDGGGAGDRVAAEGRAVVAGGEALRRVVRRRAGSRSAARSRAPWRA